jgi:NitT/TauT family transport system substrate-binding protein
MKKNKLSATLVIGLGSVLALTACNASAAGPTAGGSGSARCDPGAITVGVGPYIDVAPVYLGIKNGTFEKHGLTVKPGVISGGGAALLPSVISGDLTFAYGNFASLLVAREKKLDVVAVAHGSSSPGTGSEQGLLSVAKDSDIKNAAGLEGKTVAVNSVESLTEVMVRDAVARDGGDPKAVKVVEMKLGDMPAALSAGRVDAVATFEPFSTIVKKSGARTVSHLFDLTDDGETLIGTYFTSGRYAKECADTTAKFAVAMGEALDYAAGNPDEVRAITGTYLELDPNVRDAMAMPKFGSELGVDDAQDIIDKSLKYGLIKSAIPLDEVLWKGE